MLVLFLVGLLPLIFEGYESTQELVVCVEASLAPDPDPLTVVWFCGSDLEVLTTVKVLSAQCPLLHIRNHHVTWISRILERNLD